MGLKKSGIEYVILAGSSFFAFSRPDPDIGRVWCDPGARDFFKDFDVLVPKIHKNAGPQGLMLTLGSSHRMCGPCARAFVAHLLFVVG